MDVAMQFDPDIETLLDGPATSREFAMGGAFEGADRFNRDLALWAPPLRSADADILPDKGMVDARVRDISRNDAYVAGGQTLHKDNIVGAMFVLNCKPEWGVLGLDDKWAEEFQKEVESKFILWAESPNNWPDAARINTLTAMVRLAVGVYAASGEVLATAEWLRDTARPFKTAIQMVDLDRLSTPYGMEMNDNVRGGVEYDRFGSPQAYHIRTSHPSDYNLLNATNFGDWKRVPTRKPWGRMQVIHILEQQRVDQSRGISEMAAALKEMKITKKFRDVTLQNAVVNATYAATIESELPPEAAYAQLGGGNVGEGITGYAASYLGAISQYAGASKNMHIDGVKIPHLFPGTKLQMRPAGSPGGIGASFEASLLRYIAANLGVSYEQLSRDYSATNYSSLRGAMTETWKFMQARKRMVADRFASAVYRLWLEEAINTGQIEALKTRKAPNFYDGLNADAYSSCEWIGASRGQIDELKETQAAVLRMKYHLTTYEDEMSRLGKDWRKGFAQRAREIKLMEDMGIQTPEMAQAQQAEDNMMNAASGTGREKTASTPGDGGDKKGAND
jgi:lambda family phage portal protein